jgi:tight adherence protein C
MTIVLFGIIFAVITLVVFISLGLTTERETTADFLRRRMSEQYYKPSNAKGQSFLSPLQPTYHAILQEFQKKAKTLYGKNDGYVAKTRKLMIVANIYKSDTDVYQHFAFSLLISCVGAFTGLILAALLNIAFLYKIAVLLTCIIITRFFPDFQLRKKASDRKMSIYYAMSDILDLLVICMESGMGLDACLMRVSQDGDHLAPEFTEELKTVLFEMSSGISRAEAFRNLATRTDVAELNTLATMLIQADKFGTPIGQMLKVYSDELRQKRRMRAEELASKASIKMTFPLVLLIFPPMFMILLGPSLLQAMDTFK